MQKTKQKCEIMNLMRKEIRKNPLGVWIAMIAIGSLLFIGMGGQAYSLLDWDSAVDLGLQNDRLDGDLEESTWAKASEGEARADMIWFLPFLIIALVGVLRRTFYGFTTAMMSLSMGVYFSMIFAFTRWNLYRETVYQAMIIFTIPSLLGITGLWTNRAEFDGISIQNTTLEKEMK